jgi:hypothetical protein
MGLCISRLLQKRIGKLTKKYNLKVCDEILFESLQGFCAMVFVLLLVLIVSQSTQHNAAPEAIGAHEELNR